MNTPRPLLPNELNQSTSAMQEQDEDVTRHIITCMIVGRNICARATLRPKQDDKLTIKHTVQLKPDGARHIVNKWIIRWPQMTQVTRLLGIPNSNLHDALRSLRAAGYYVSQHVFLYNRTANNRFIGWGSDPVMIYHGIEKRGDQNLPTFNFDEWSEHIRCHQRKLDKIRGKMHDLIKCKRDMEEIWAKLRVTVDTELSETTDEWWKYDVEPMVHETISSVVILKLPVCDQANVNGEQLSVTEPSSDEESLAHIARSIEFERFSATEDH